LTVTSPSIGLFVTLADMRIEYGLVKKCTINHGMKRWVGLGVIADNLISQQGSSILL
jgi:hypothetical protein